MVGIGSFLMLIITSFTQAAAMMALVEATAGMMFFTTPKVRE